MRLSPKGADMSQDRQFPNSVVSGADAPALPSVPDLRSKLLPYAVILSTASPSLPQGGPYNVRCHEASTTTSFVPSTF